MESRTPSSRRRRKPRPRAQKNPMPRTALPRTDPLEAKDRNAQSQGQGPRTQAQVFSPKKDLQKFFYRSPKKRSPKIFFRRSPVEENKKGLCKFSARFGEFSNNISTVQKIVLSSSRGKGIFRRLEALKPKARLRT